MNISELTRRLDELTESLEEGKVINIGLCLNRTLELGHRLYVDLVLAKSAKKDTDCYGPALILAMTNCAIMADTIIANKDKAPSKANVPFALHELMKMLLRLEPHLDSAPISEALWRRIKGELRATYLRIRAAV